MNLFQQTQNLGDFAKAKNSLWKKKKKKESHVVYK